MKLLFTCFSAVILLSGVLAISLLLGRTVLSSLKEKRPGLDCFDQCIFSVFLGLFVFAFCLLIKCGIADPIRAMWF